MAWSECPEPSSQGHGHHFPPSSGHVFQAGPSVLGLAWFQGGHVRHVGLANFLIAMTRHPTRNNLRKEGLEDAAVTVGRAWWQWCEVAGPLPSVVRKEREKEAGRGADVPFIPSSTCSELHSWLALKVRLHSGQ